MIRVFARTCGPGPCELSPEESHYLVRVRRARTGAAVEVLDGRGAIFSARVVAARPDRAILEIEGPIDRPAPPWDLDLLVAIPEVAATVEVVQHATALGVRTLRFVETARSHARLPSPARLERVVRSCLRQCGRPTMPTIESVSSLDEAVSRSPLPGFVGVPGARPASPWSGEAATLAVGPEGGWTDEEVARLCAAGFVPVGLGPWILRTPLAVAAGAAAVAAVRGAGPAA